jgi:hypothetical protein
MQGKHLDGKLNIVVQTTTRRQMKAYDSLHSSIRLKSFQFAASKVSASLTNRPQNFWFEDKVHRDADHFSSTTLEPRVAATGSNRHA